jgi:hypothetical protein
MLGREQAELVQKPPRGHDQDASKGHRVEPRGQRGVAVPDLTGQDLENSIAGRGDHRKHGDPAKALTGRVHRHQHAGKPGHQRANAVRTDAFLQPHRSQDRDHQGGCEEQRRDLGQPHKGKGGVEQRKPEGKERAAREMQGPERGQQPMRTPQDQDQRDQHDHGNDATPKDQHPDRVEAQKRLHHPVLPYKKQHAQDHAADAFGGARGGNARCWLQCGHAVGPGQSAACQNFRRLR